ncbi:hypothetical protein [Micromonospora aurantiaca]|uniref:hypothetical protein n=1 Tax=Micromonospora aurantiaca (nom. illeg.) TaxID=47850 RepID=UPI003809A2BF
MRAAITLTPPVDLIGMPGLIGSARAALLGIATALTVSRSRTTRTITVPGLAIGYAIVFTSDTSSALLVGYLVALTWWAIQLTAHTLRLAYPGTGQALRRLAGSNPKGRQPAEQPRPQSLDSSRRPHRCPFNDAAAGFECQRALLVMKAYKLSRRQDKEVPGNIDRQEPGIAICRRVVLDGISLFLNPLQL